VVREREGWEREGQWWQREGFSTQASTPIKCFIRNGWPDCCCMPYRIPLTLNLVLPKLAAVNEIKGICSHYDLIHKRVAA